MCGTFPKTPRGERPYIGKPCSRGWELGGSGKTLAPSMGVVMKTKNHEIVDFKFIKAIMW